MSDRSAPEGGYRFLEKKLYRQHIWNRFRRLVGTSGHILLMPSSEGDEILLAQKKGFRLDRMHVVDRNPAIVATLKRRFGSIHTYGVSASVACRRIAAKGIRLSAANFDFCSCISSDLDEELIGIAQADCWLAPDYFGAKSAMAITVLRGRETEAASIAMEFSEKALKAYGLDTFQEAQVIDGELSNRDRGRLSMLKLGLMQGGLALDANMAGIYYSPSCGQSMLWSVYSVLARERPSGESMSVGKIYREIRLALSGCSVEEKAWLLERLEMRLTAKWRSEAGLSG